MYLYFYEYSVYLIMLHYMYVNSAFTKLQTPFLQHFFSLNLLYNLYFFFTL